MAIPPPDFPLRWEMDKAGRITIKGDDDGGHRTPDSQVHGGADQQPGDAEPDGTEDSGAATKNALTATLQAQQQAAFQAAVACQAGGLMGRSLGLGPTDDVWADTYAQMLQGQHKPQIQAAAYQGLTNAYYGSLDYVPLRIQDDGVRLGEVIGWRAWRVEHGWLYSMAMQGCEWQPGQVLEAHEVNADHGGGIHAFKTRKAVIDEYGTDGTIVVGSVALWGQIYEFESGYHAEFARVHSLDWTNIPEPPTKRRRKGFFWTRDEARADPTILDQLRQTYGLTEPPHTAS